ncbi:MAG: hypothetical protein N2712_04535 [Brevinematales bacterium]|nr:hypothetical protein [Brevinematales bacterium]
MSLFNLIFRISKYYRNCTNWWPYYSDKSEIVISSILAQNTKWSNVLKSLNNIKEYLCLTSLDALKGIKIEVLEELIKPSGFYRSKASTILSVLEYMELTGGYSKLKKSLFSRVFKSASMKEVFNVVDQFRRELISIKGIGKETADSIILYSFDLPSFVVDNYTIRVTNRFLGKNFCKIKDYDFFKLEVEKVIVSDFVWFRRISKCFNNKNNTFTFYCDYGGLLLGELVCILTCVYKVIHAGFVEIGKNFCTKSKVRCNICLLSEGCRFYEYIVKFS